MNSLRSVTSGTPAEQLVGLYRSMARIRSCEQALMRYFNEGLIYGTVHLSVGQEAVAVGICAALAHSDYLTTTHRGHGWALAKGVPLTRFMAELFGRTDGVCSGRGGSMHLCDMSVGLIGASGIVAGGIPGAVGAALASQVSGKQSVAVASFGEGATNNGTFHESINLAAVWKLPVVFVCENNLYGEFSPASKTCLLDQFADRANAYGIPGVTVDGNDVRAVLRVASEAVTRARRGDGPTLIEAKTYRQSGHSRNDAGKYRSREEVTEWLLRDPLGRAQKELRSMGAWDDSAETKLQADLERDLVAAVEFAKASPFPEPADVEVGTYSH